MPPPRSWSPAQPARCRRWCRSPRTGRPRSRARWPPNPADARTGRPSAQDRRAWDARAGTRRCRRPRAPARIPRSLPPPGRRRPRPRSAGPARPRRPARRPAPRPVRPGRPARLGRAIATWPRAPAAEARHRATSRAARDRKRTGGRQSPPPRSPVAGAGARRAASGPGPTAPAPRPRPRPAAHPAGRAAWSWRMRRWCAAPRRRPASTGCRRCPCQRGTDRCRPSPAAPAQTARPAPRRPAGGARSCCPGRRRPCR